jgi:hypothetical protein
VAPVCKAARGSLSVELPTGRTGILTAWAILQAMPCSVEASLVAEFWVVLLVKLRPKQRKSNKVLQNSGVALRFS